jgi:hypothetical protein
MKKKALSVLAGIGGAMIVGNVADASYQGLTVVLHTIVDPSGATPLQSVWRVYALFSDPGDFVTSVAGSPTLGNLSIQSRNALDSAVGGAFFNAGGGSTAPGQTLVSALPNAEWDSFATIGLAIVPDGFVDETGTSPGFPTFIVGTSLESNNAGWFTAGPQPQGTAGNGIFNVDPINNPGEWGVLIMQLTVNAGNNVRGTVAIGGGNNNPLAGQTTFQTNADQVFNSFPAPGALALLGLAGVVSSRRRRG